MSLDSPERDVLLSDGPSPAITPVTPPASVLAPRLAHAHDDMFTHSSFDEVNLRRVHDARETHAGPAEKYFPLLWSFVAFVQLEEEEESSEASAVAVSVSDPEKVGEFRLSLLAVTPLRRRPFHVDASGFCRPQARA